MINIGIDCDGVQFGFSSLYSQLIHDMYPEENYPLHGDNDVPAWNWDEWHPAGKERIAAAWKKFHSTENIFLQQPVLENVDYMVKNLNNHPKINVYHITSRAETAGLPIIKQTIKQLENAGWSNPQVIISFSKGGVARVLDLKYFLDDRAENCAEVALYNPPTKVFLLDKLHNQYLQEKHFKVTRIKSVVAFTDAVLAAVA